MSIEFSDNYFMDVALARARNAALDDEVPVGAIFVSYGTIFASDGNERETSNDPSAHAEILCLRKAAEFLKSWRLPEGTLYVTVEPCLMCTGAIYLARIPRVVFGCPNPKGGALRYVSAREAELNVNHKVDVVPGVRELECARVIREFFATKRQERKDPSLRDKTKFF